MSQKKSSMFPFFVKEFTRIWKLTSLISIGIEPDSGDVCETQSVVEKWRLIANINVLYC